MSGVRGVPVDGPAARGQRGGPHPRLPHQRVRRHLRLRLLRDPDVLRPEPGGQDQGHQQQDHLLRHQHPVRGLHGPLHGESQSLALEVACVICIL